MEQVARYEITTGSILPSPPTNAKRTIETTGDELVIDGAFNLGQGLARRNLAQQVVRLLGSLSLGGLLLGSLLAQLLLAQTLAIVRLPPLTERRGVNLHDGGLHQRLGTHQLVVGRVVDNVDNTRLARNGLRAPREVARVQAHGAELLVSTADAHRVNALGANLRVRRLAAELKLSLLAILGALGSSVGALVAAITADT